MDIKKLQTQLEIDEGVRYYVYLDTLGKPTFGIGHLLLKTDVEYAKYKALAPGQKLYISKERVAEVFENDVKTVVKDCCSYLPDFLEYPEEVQQVVANMMFNLGLTKMKKLFKQFQKNLLAKNYKMAAKEMQFNDGTNPSKGESAWYQQTKDRAKRLVARMNKLADDTLCSVKA